MPLGRWGGLAFRLGGGSGIKRKEYLALRESLSPNRQGYNVDDDLIDIENEAHALALAQIWAANKRTANQAIPARQLEEVTRSEEILRLRPDPADSDQDRRAAIEAKLRGLAGNTIADVEDVARSILGANFVGVYTVDSADQITWWPGVNPGPPGFEWYSNRCAVGVAMSRAGLSDSEVDAKLARLEETLDSMLSAWMVFCVGTEDPDDDGGFICDIGVCDLTLL